VSVRTGGSQANGASNIPWITAKGRFVAFESGAKNLVGNDTNDEFDIFLRGPLR
jgi:hypothetical protein